MSKFRTLIVVVVLSLVGCGGYESNNCPDQPGETGSNPGQLRVAFTTAFHAAAPFRVHPGAVGVVFGSFLFDNQTSDTIDVRQVRLTVLVSDDPVTGAYDGSLPKDRVADHLNNCVLRQWPELTVYMGPTVPQTNGTIFLHDLFSLTPGEGAALDVICDFTTQPPATSSEGFAIDIATANDVKATDASGQAVRIDLAKQNGNPPKLAAILE